MPTDTRWPTVYLPDPEEKTDEVTVDLDDYEIVLEEAAAKADPWVIVDPETMLAVEPPAEPVNPIDMVIGSPLDDLDLERDAELDLQDDFDQQHAAYLPIIKAAARAYGLRDYKLITPEFLEKARAERKAQNNGPLTERQKNRMTPEEFETEVQIAKARIAKLAYSR